MKKSILALILFALLTLLATHPLWQQLTDSLPGDVGDPVLNASIIAWDAHLLVTDPAHLFDSGFYYPLPGALAYTENVSGSALLALPVILITGQPALAYNVVFLLSFVLSGYGTYLLLLRITHNRAAGIIAGVAFAFAPYHLAALAHIQLLTVQWLALMLLAPARGTQSRTPPFAIFFIFLWLQIASTLHGAAFALLIVVVVSLVQWRRLPSLATAAFIVPAVVFAIALVPLVLPYLAVLDQLRAARPAALALSLSATPTDFLAAAGRLFGPLTRTFRARPDFTEEQVLFMGVITPLLAGGGLVLGLAGRKQPRSALSNSAGVSPREWFSGYSIWHWVFALLLLASLFLAFGGLVELLPIASVMRVPARWAGVTVFALAGLCGLAVAKISSAQTRWMLYCLLGVAIFVEGFSAPIPLAFIGTVQAQHSVYQYLAELPGREAVLELPMYVAPDAEAPEAKRMVAAIVHWRPLVNGYSGITPPRQAALGAQMKDFPGEHSLAALRELSRQGVRYLIVHSGEPGLPRRAWVQDGRARAIASGELRFIRSFDDNDLFEITPDS